MENYKGCTDNQSVLQKQKNFKLNEVCSVISPVIWTDKEIWTSYPKRDQNGSLTCVCQTLSTEMGIIAKEKYNEWIDFSASFPYQQRGGKDSVDYGGSSSDDIYTHFPKIGNIPELLMPSQNMHEVEVLAVPRKKYFSDLAKPFSVNRIELPVDFETVASTIQATGKGVMVWFHINSPEWTDKPQVIGTTTNSNHSVAAVDFGLIGGKKYLRIKDSVLTGALEGGYRFISEEYFKARCYLASYLKTFNKLVITSDTVKPSFNGSVKSLQECLIYEGLMSVGLNTGFFGNITKNALIQFQKKYAIVPSIGNFGPITKTKLFSLFP